MTQILAVHPIRHPSGVRVPRHEVGDGIARTHQIISHGIGPDEAVRSEQPECAGHLPRVEIALLPHQIFEKADLALIEIDQLTVFV